MPTKTATPQPQPQPPAYRLLYRGALALPDSRLLLDGLTFGARLSSPMKQKPGLRADTSISAGTSGSSFMTNTPHLLENPLALALESMRGRPTLRLVGSIKMGEVYLDESGRVEMDIHPLALLSQVFFENTFCLLPFPSSSLRSEVGLRVALGDSDGPETTHIVIYAERIEGSSVERAELPGSQSIRLHVARIAPRPPPAQPRGPRPDDPIPRRPPALFARTGSMRGGELKRAASGNRLAPLKRQKTVGAVADLGSEVRLGAGAGVEVGMFKVPALPAQTNGKGKEKEKEGDVFGEPAQVADTALEKANRNVIKRLTVEYLSRARDPADPTRYFDKAHPEFKELYGHIYRGVGFALRGEMRTASVEINVVNRLIDKHALMYLPRSSGSGR